jgi:hypothetical protein
MESRLKDVVARSNPANTPEVVTLETMPTEPRKEAENITASINTDGMGAVRIVRPTPDSIVGIGVFGADTKSQSSVLILGDDGRTLKINYGSSKDESSPDLK